MLLPSAFCGETQTPNFRMIRTERSRHQLPPNILHYKWWHKNPRNVCMYIYIYIYTHTRWAKSRYTLYSIFKFPAIIHNTCKKKIITVYLLLAHLVYIYIQDGPKVGIQYIVYLSSLPSFTIPVKKKNNYCIPTFGPPCIYIYKVGQK